MSSPTILPNITSMFTSVRENQTYNLENYKEYACPIHINYLMELTGRTSVKRTVKELLYLKVENQSEWSSPCLGV